MISEIQLLFFSFYFL